MRIAATMQPAIVGATGKVSRVLWNRAVSLGEEAQRTSFHEQRTLLLLLLEAAFRRLTRGDGVGANPPSSPRDSLY